MWLQTAAGIYRYLRDVVVPTLTCVIPTDFTPEALNMIENIMLAQVWWGTADGVRVILGLRPIPPPRNDRPKLASLRRQWQIARRRI